MALKTGLVAQLGFVKESVYGTYVAPTRFIDFVTESLKLDIARVESKAIRSGQRVQRSDDWRPGAKTVSGDIEFELWNKSFGLLFELMIGGSATTVTATGGVSTHTYTPGDLGSATFQVGVPNVTGGVVALSYTGMMCDAWELASSINDPVKVKVSLKGQAEDQGQGLASASYATGVELLTFVGGGITIAGTTVPVSKISLKGKNGLNAGRFFLGSQNMSQPLEADMREYTGDLEAEFTDLTAYNRFVSGTEAALVLTFAGVANPTHKLVITCNARFDGDTPTVKSTDLIPQTLKYKLVATGLDSTALSLAYTTPDVAP